MKSLIKSIIDKYLETRQYECTSFSIDYPPEDVFGDYSTNLAMVLAKIAKQNPLNIANDFKTFCQENNINAFDIKIEKPGFINFYIQQEALKKELLLLSQKKEAYFKPESITRNIQIEFVSANPTGPLHIGHGRGAAIGDSLARILTFLGHNVTREYYINDAGYQMHMLGLSTFLRYKELLGHNIEFPEDGYQGEYIKDIAQELIKTHKDKLLSIGEEEAINICKEAAKTIIMNDILNDMKNFRVSFDVFFSESSLYANNEVENTLNYLAQKGHTYEKDGALWLNTTQFGDDKDRVLVKSDGKYTYLASDIAYHKNKFLSRNFDQVIDIWGSDHHGYVARLKAALECLGIDSKKLIVLLVQFVNLIQENNKISMSTRKATYIELKELIKEIGVDAARFIFVSKSINSHLDIDVSLLKQSSMDNPVYYIQYAHARIKSILEKGNCDKTFDENLIDLLKEPEELNLIKALFKFKDYLLDSAKVLEPYLITKALLIIAERLHQFYNKHKVIIENKELSCARVNLIKTVAFVLALGLSLIGIEAKNKM